MSREEILWIVRDPLKCSGCRRCEIVCSLHHEGKIWPEASRIRIFMLFPGVEVPHLCVQCHDYPCVSACPVEALSVDDETGAVKVDRDKCTGCGICIDKCPGRIPFLHPGDGKVVICDLCDGDPECVKVCREAGFNALMVVRERRNRMSRKIFAQPPEEIARDLAVNIYGERGEGLI